MSGSSRHSSRRHPCDATLSIAARLRCARLFRSRSPIRSMTATWCFRSSGRSTRSTRSNRSGRCSARRLEPDYEAAAPRSRARRRPSRWKRSFPQLVHYLQGMFIWGHPRAQINVVPNPTIASLIGVLLPLAYNPNLCSDESGRLFSEAEVRAAAMTAALVGYPTRRGPRRVHLRRHRRTALRHENRPRKGLPGSGIARPARAGGRPHFRPKPLLLPDRGRLAGHRAGKRDRGAHAPGQLDSHRCARTRRPRRAGRRQADRRDRRHDGFDRRLRHRRPGGIDRPAAPAGRRVRARPTCRTSMPTRLSAGPGRCSTTTISRRNPLEFRGRTVRALAAAQTASGICRWPIRSASISTRPATPPTFRRWCCSATRDDLERIGRPPQHDALPVSIGRAHPGLYTLETTRSAPGPMAALANLLLLGKEGYRTLLGHAVEMAEVLRERIEAHPHLSVLNGENVGPVTLFRAYPDDVDTFTRSTARTAPIRQLSRPAAGTQRIQPADFRARAGRGAARARRGDFADQLLSPHRLRRADRGAQVVRPLAVFR